MTNEATNKTHDPLCIGGNKGPCNCGATDERYPYYGDAYKLSADGPVERVQSGPVATDEQKALDILDSTTGLPEDVMAEVYKNWPNSDLPIPIKIAAAFLQGWSLEQIRDDVKTYFRLSLTRDNSNKNPAFEGGAKLLSTAQSSQGINHNSQSVSTDNSEAIRVAIEALESAKWTIYGDLKTQKEATLETIDKAIEALGEK